MAAANGVGGDGCVRASEREEAEERRATGRVIERSRGFGISVALRETSRGRRRQPGREEVAGARGRARRARARPPGREEDDRGGSGDGLGRLGRLVAARWAAGEWPR